MIQLSISAAHAYVRKVLDELTSVEELGMLVSPDSMDLHKLVEGFIVEAAVRVHTNAPSHLLDGIVGVIGTDYTAEPEGKVVTITMKSDCVRIASIKAKDSDHVVCDLIPEDSAEGRMQLNSYLRGTYDDPRAVLMKRWEGEYLPVVKYYSLMKEEKEEEKEEEKTDKPATAAENPDAAAEPIVSVEYIPYPVIDETIIMVSPRLEYNVLNEIAAMVLDAVNESQKAQLYRAKAQNYGG